MLQEICNGRRSRLQKGKTDGNDVEELMLNIPVASFVSAAMFWIAMTPSFVTAEGIGEQVVRGFYEALADGNGKRAAVFISPGKRTAKSYRPEALTNYYGQMNEPLRLESLERIHEYEYDVQYHFRGHGVTCNGRSTIYLEQSVKGVFIGRIVAHDRC